jgi:(2Fe-2S) ferredoxin
LSVRLFKVLVCRGPECGERRDSRRVYEAFRHQIETAGLTGTVEMGWQSCFGRCTQGPNALVREVREGEPAFAFAALPGPRGVTALYNRLDALKVERIVAEHIQRGVIVRELIERPTLGKPPGDR